MELNHGHHPFQGRALPAELCLHNGTDDGNRTRILSRDRGVSFPTRPHRYKFGGLWWSLTTLSGFAIRYIDALTTTHMFVPCLIPPHSGGVIRQPPRVGMDIALLDFHLPVFTTGRSL